MLIVEPSLYVTLKSGLLTRGPRCKKLDLRGWIARFEVLNMKSPVLLC